MPAIFELLYKEFCRARLAEMRKQLLLTGKRPELLGADDGFSDPDGADRTDATPPEEWTRVRK
ncbi:hypothetical protein [Bradyrhizobium sp. Y36]|uniref:hypothetical protein n=1 Tax=Bradyrhizobium sp. Y36 TaxID=2035447 RepID=UPI00117842F7|nr:hypothetical protein [Bradyrhizobium sp. Y36]